MFARLKELGLGEYERKAYAGLLQHGTMKGGELSKITGVPHGKIYTALHNLAKKQFVTIVDIKPQLFSAVDPKIALAAAIQQEIKDLEQLKKDVLKDARTMRAPTQEQTIEQVKVFPGRKARDAINLHFFNDAQKEVRFMFTYEERVHKLERAIYAAVKRGLKVRIIATLMTKDGERLMRKDVRNGVDVRYYRVEEMRLNIMDKKESRLEVVNPRNRRDRVLIYYQNGDISKHFANYFDSLWKKAKKISSI
ncbi:MAG: hypothetical protein OXR66_00050 [Candidatus Woesearchaeota archaeon]|nr:hypothetical protein [Candidatus Woesearchaeota archaeon]